MPYKIRFMNRSVEDTDWIKMIARSYTYNAKGGDVADSGTSKCDIAKHQKRR